MREQLTGLKKKGRPTQEVWDDDGKTSRKLKYYFEEQYVAIGDCRIDGLGILKELDLRRSKSEGPPPCSVLSSRGVGDIILVTGCQHAHASTWVSII